jgi:hypothetical protein
VPDILRSVRRIERFNVVTGPTGIIGIAAIFFPHILARLSILRPRKYRWVMASVSRFLTSKLRLTVNEAKSAVARPEERKFLGFSISNDGSERRIVPEALDKFKMQVRDMTRRTRGIGLQQLVEDLRPYLIGRRGYFDFCQTPRVLTNLEAWIGRRLRVFGGSGRTGTTASKNCAVVACQSSMQRLPPVHRRGSGACRDTRRSNKHCATTISTEDLALRALGEGGQGRFSVELGSNLWSERESSGPLAVAHPAKPASPLPPQ